MKITIRELRQIISEAVQSTTKRGKMSIMENNDKVIDLTWEQVKKEFTAAPYGDNSPAAAFEVTFDGDNPWTPADFTFWLERTSDPLANDPEDPKYLPTRPGYALLAQAPDEPVALEWDGEVWS